MKTKNGKIGFLELFSICTLIIMVKAQDMTPLNLFPDGATATWMFPIIWYGIMFIPMIFVNLLLKKYKNKNFFDIIYLLTGKYIGFFITLLLFIILFSALIVDSRSYIDIINNLIYLKTPPVILYLVLIGASYLVAKRGIEIIGRVTWILFPIIVGSLVIIIIILLDKFIYDNIYPLFGTGVKEIATTGIRTSSLIGEFILFAVLFNFVKDYKTFRNGLLFGLGLGCVLVSIIFLLLILVFDFEAPGVMTHAYTQLVKQTRIGIFIPNLSALFIDFWLMTAVIRFSIYLYGSASFFAYSIKIKRFEPLLLPLATLTIIIGLLPENPFISVFVIRELIINQSWYIFVSLPIILWVISKKKGEIKNENS